MNSDLPVPALVLVSLPIIITVAILIVTLVFIPRQGSTDIRSSAAPIIVSPTPVPAILTSETACSSPYSPVCGVNGTTYLNQCEANKASVQVATKQECAEALPISTPPDKIASPTEQEGIPANQ